MAGDVLCPYCGKRVEMSLPVVKEGSEYLEPKRCCHFLFGPYEAQGETELLAELLNKAAADYQSLVDVASRGLSLPCARKRELGLLARQDPRLREVEGYFFIESKDALHDLLKKLENEIEAAHKAGRAHFPLG